MPLEIRLDDQLGTLMFSVQPIDFCIRLLRINLSVGYRRSKLLLLLKRFVKCEFIFLGHCEFPSIEAMPIRSLDVPMTSATTSIITKDR